MEKKKKLYWTDLKQIEEELKKNKHKKKKENETEEKEKSKIGRCFECNRGDFNLIIKEHKLVRTCKHCNDKKSEDELIEILDKYA